MELAGAIRELCKRSGLSQRGLAEKAGFKAVTSIANPIARGDLKLSTLLKIADAAGYDVMLLRRDNFEGERAIRLEPTEKHKED